jgi:uncharacterized membrane protein YhaH (DUF805 family)
MSAPQYPQPQYPSQVPGVSASAPPLWAPYYGAPFGEAVRRVFKKYAAFSGRAGRAEYWWWALVGVVVAVVLNVVIAAGMETSTDSYAGNAYSAPTPGPLSAVGYVLLAVWGLGVVVPSLALTVRRLHDVNLSGWTILLGLVPFLGGLAVLVFTLLPPNPAGQRFDQPRPAAYTG